MMKQLAILLLGILFFSKSFGHTSYPDTVYCPLDNSMVIFNITMSMTTFGGYADFEKKGAIGDYYFQFVNSCPKCHFSAFDEDFKKKFSDVEKESLRNFLNQFKDKDFEEPTQCEIAGEIYKFLNSKNTDIAFCYLVGSYHLRNDENQTERRKQFQKNVILFYLAGLNKNEIEKPNRASYIYLVGEMYRRLGDFENAILYYNKAIDDKNKKDWVKKASEEQKALAEKKDANNLI
jgi:uncharacterized protein (DUF2225 family)